MQRIVDVIYSLPDVLIILLIATAMSPHVTQFITDHQGFFLAEFFKKVGPNLMGMFIAFACLYWVGMSRIIRGQILTLKKQEYVTAAVPWAPPAAGSSSGTCCPTASARSWPPPACRSRPPSSLSPSCPSWAWACWLP